MPTDNERALLIYKEELNQFLEGHFERFSTQLNEILVKFERENHIEIKPLSIEQVASRYNVSKVTVHNWIKAKKIEGFKQGKGRYFHLHELDKNLKGFKNFERLQKTGEVPQAKSYFDFLRE